MRHSPVDTNTHLHAASIYSVENAHNLSYFVQWYFTKETIIHVLYFRKSWTPSLNWLNYDSTYFCNKYCEIPLFYIFALESCFSCLLSLNIYQNVSGSYRIRQCISNHRHQTQYSKVFMTYWSSSHNFTMVFYHLLHNGKPV